MRQSGRHEREAALFEHCLFVPDAHLEAPGEDVDRLFLRVVDVEWRPAVRCDLDDEVIERAAGVVAGDLGGGNPTSSKTERRWEPSS